QMEGCELTNMEGGALRRLTNSRSSPLHCVAPALTRALFALLHRKRRIPSRTMRLDEYGATPSGRPPMLAHSRARGARPCIGSPRHQPRRKRPAHFPSVTVGFRSIIIFLTVCTRHRKGLLANDAAAQLIVESWQTANFWRVGRFVIMPNHIHLF